MILAKRFLNFGLLSLVLLAACQTSLPNRPQQKQSSPLIASNPKAAEAYSDEVKKILESATEQTKVTKGYDPAYIVLPYPMGDVPMETGVCTDVVIRAFRNAGVDLQKEVHEDMQANFTAYPKRWGLKTPDTNIDIAAFRICKLSLPDAEISINYG